MKKTIKIIDLLVKIANGEEVPKKIKFRNALWIYSEENQDYLEYNKDYSDLFGYAFCNLKTLDFINDEVEIIDEEEFEDIKPLVLRTFERTGQAITTDRLEDYCDYNFEMIENTIAKIVLNQKKIIERLNKEN